MTKINIDRAITDFEWVIKVLESSEDEGHMETTMRCFSLWDSKYMSSKLSENEMKTLTNLKQNFWSSYKNKNTKIGTFNF